MEFFHCPFFCVLILEFDMEPLTKTLVTNVEIGKATIQDKKVDHDNYINMLRMFSINQKFIKEIALHSKSLSPETINTLEQKQLPKEFFDQAQIPKSRLIRDLQGEGVGEVEITEIVSKVMEIFIEEYETTGKVTNWKNLSKLFLEGESEDVSKKISPVKDKIFKYRPSPLFNLTLEKPDVKKIEEELAQATDKLSYVANKQKFGSMEMVKNIDQIVSRLSRISYNLKLKV